MKYFRKSTRMSKHKKPPSLHLHTISTQGSPWTSAVFSDCDADDEGFMSAEDMSPRPLSLAIPGVAPYCPRRPTLQEVLTNKAPSPWTLTAFMAYLSQNHCLETLEFTMDAQRYTAHYSSLVPGEPLTPISPSSPGCEYVRMLWKRLIDAYITPNGPREVNLPSNVRDRLLSLPYSNMPPDAEELEPAVKIIFELMDESVLMPFVYSVAPGHITDSFVPSMVSCSGESMSPANAYIKEAMTSPPLSSTGDETLSGSSEVTSPRPLQPSNMNLARYRARSTVIASPISNTPGLSSWELIDSMTDDSADSASPSLSANEPMTPPNTPPTSNATFISPGSSPHNSRPESTMRVDMEVLSDDGPSPVLEAHPGSPMDLSTARRPSLAASLARSSHDTRVALSNSERTLQDMGQIESVGRDGMAAKGLISKEEGNEEWGTSTRLITPEDYSAAELSPIDVPSRAHRSHFFIIPDKIPEYDDMLVTTTAISDVNSVEDDMYFQFEADETPWATINSEESVSRSSLATAVTQATTMEDQRYSTALTVGTSVASSAASMMSSAASTYCSSANSTDIYGWEEELDRKSSIDTVSWDQESGRRGRHYSSCGVPRRKNKRLLYKAFSMSERRSGDIPTIPELPANSPVTPVTANAMRLDMLRNSCT
ncbi:hypothetical protein BJ878DRAFT_421484 [Calycina marina]|uniref:RGS domain-containing protein n=1 Tax=Calycina marina TaxID=1763456 RepID=A0A9P8CEQ8_9HELO|nr:hypothetical protein BJ878DRAFT_421484 [Calycina marina]